MEKQLVELAVEKGFKAKTLTTIWTQNKYTTQDKGLINKECIYLLLCEIQKWLREVHKLHIEIIPENQDYKTVWHPIVYHIMIPEETINCGFQDTYEEALESGIKFHLESI